ncbi:MAG: limonene-1,2-epoxide hydrolase family protein [Acidimicrobiia bacterium]
MSSENEKRVLEFCEAWSRRDIDELVGFFAEDAVYHNMPIGPVKGHEGIRQILGLFVPPSQSIEFEVLRMASDGDYVLTERVDRFVMGDKKVELPAAGVFELRDGKIAAWRDYFDMQTWTKQTTE